jgi:hypothetical protein
MLMINNHFLSGRVCGTVGFLVLILALGGVHSARAQQQVGLYQVHELSFTATGSYGNPYLDASLSATFTGPSQQTLTIDGFWDGGNIWRVRMAPTALGTWTYTTSSSDPGLNGQNGSFVAVGSSSRGHVRVSTAYPFTFEYSDGTPFFWLGDTNWDWCHLSTRFDDGSFQNWIDTRADQGYTLVQGTLVPARVFGSPRYQGQNEGGQVYNNFTNESINPDYFKWMDDRVEYIMDQGLALAFWFMWSGDYHHGMSGAKFRRFIRYVVSRYTAYNVIWGVMGEYEEASASETRSAGSYTKSVDPYQHPLTTHTLDTTADDFDNEDWIDFHGQQSWSQNVSGYNERARSDRSDGKPVIQMEICYEDEGCGEIPRRAGWAFLTGGGFFTYGQKNIAWDKPANWSSHLHRPQGEQMAHVRAFWEPIEWWSMSPDNSLVNNGFALAQEGQEYVVYLPNGGSVRVDLSAASGELSAEWFNPRNGETISAGMVSGGGNRNFTAPDGNDWVLHIGGAPPDSTPPSQPQNLDAEAVGEFQIDLDWDESSDPESGIAHYKIYRDGLEAGQSSGSSYQDQGLQENTSYIYEVSAVNRAGLESAKSDAAAATTWGDTQPPAILSATAISATQVDVQFSEPVEEASAEEETNYQIDPGVAVYGATLDADLTTVHLSTSEHAEGVNYTLTVNNVRDRAASPNTIAPNSSVQYQVVLELVVDDLNKGNYQVAHLDVGDEYYVDRPYTVASLPSIYQNLTWIKTANDDKYEQSEQFLSFTVNQNVTAYIAYDHRASSPPDWITEHYTATGDAIGVSDTDASPLELWACDFPAGTITMGANLSEGASGAMAMYIVLLRGVGAEPDTTAPLISQISVSAVDQSTATMIWTTDELSDSQVEYGLTTAYGAETPVDTAPVLEHQVDVSGLTSATLYHYRVRSADGSGNAAYSGDGTFETLGDVTPPVISDILVTDISETAATVTWTTDEPSDSQVEYGWTLAYGSETPLDAEQVLDHGVDLSDLSPGRLYHYRVRSADGSGNAAYSEDQTFQTPGDVIPPVISNVVVMDVSDAGAIVTWSTDEPADSRVEYGLAADTFDWSVEDSSLTLSHNLELLDLTADTEYHFQVLSGDAHGNVSITQDSTFQTKFELPGTPGKPEHVDD